MIAERDGRASDFLFSEREDFIPSNCSFSLSTSDVSSSWWKEIAFIAESRAFAEDWIICRFPRTLSTAIAILTASSYLWSGSILFQKPDSSEALSPF